MNHVKYSKLSNDIWAGEQPPPTNTPRYNTKKTVATALVLLITYVCGILTTVGLTHLIHVVQQDELAWLGMLLQFN